MLSNATCEKRCLCLVGAGEGVHPVPQEEVQEGGEEGAQEGAVPGVPKVLSDQERGGVSFFFSQARQKMPLKFLQLLEEKPRQVCKSVPKRSCKTKYRQDCKSVPQKSCHTVYKEKCQRLPKKQCKTVHRKKCSQEPYNVSDNLEKY